jgi:ribosomal protein L11
MEFCKNFNEQTKGQEGLILPVVIDVYEDKKFSFVIKTPPCSILLKRACGIAKASGEPNKTKMKDLNTQDLGKAIKIVEGTARSMGIDVVDKITMQPVLEPVKKEPAVPAPATAAEKPKDEKAEQKAKRSK